MTFLATVNNGHSCTVLCQPSASPQSAGMFFFFTEKLKTCYCVTQFQSQHHLSKHCILQAHALVHDITLDYSFSYCLWPVINQSKMWSIPSLYLQILKYSACRLCRVCWLVCILQWLLDMFLCRTTVSWCVNGCQQEMLHHARTKQRHRYRLKHYNEK